MSRKFFSVLLISLFFVSQSAFSQDSQFGMELVIPAFESVAYLAAEADIEGEDASISQTIPNNEFFRESVRLTGLAQSTFDYGDYDASASFAEEAIYYAQLSDEYVADQLLVEAKRLLDWADSNNIAARYPNDYNESKGYYETSVSARSDEDWAEAIDSAIKSIEILAALETGRSPSSLPSQYTVRTWASVRDCLWNIAGYSWAYGDPERWRVLYEANKAKLPNPDNPDLIEPGMVLDIPSIRGETRRGMWEPGRN
jgi:nucleoid-associated protein YgaU